MNGRAGFTIVEVIVAVILLAIGALGLAGTTAFLVRQTTAAGLMTERTAALGASVERIQALPYDSIDQGSDSVGAFTVEWVVLSEANEAKSIQLITLGPGLTSSAGRAPTVQPSVPDTFLYSVVRP